MTSTERKGVNIGLVVTVLTVIGLVLGWIGGTFAHGKEYGSLQGQVQRNTEDIRDLRSEIRAGFDRLSDKLDERTVRNGGTP